MKINTELLNQSIKIFESILLDFKELNRKKYEAVINIQWNLIENLTSLIRAHAGEKFALTVNGSFKQTLAFGPPGKNHERSVPFDIIYVGKIKNPNSGFYDFESRISNEHFLWRTQSALEFPWSDLYIFDFSEINTRNQGFIKAEDNEKLFVWKMGKDCPEWHINNLIKNYVPDEIFQTFFKDSKPIYSEDVQMGLYIGDVEYASFEKNSSEFIRNILPVW